MAYSYDTINDFRVGYDFQKEWIEGRGIFLMLALFMGMVGGGVFITSALMDWKWGLAVGLGVVAVGKGLSHLLDLGRPMRALRMVTRLQTSWVSRGFLFMVLFLISGIVYFFIKESGNQNRAVEAIACFWAFWMVIYAGFEMAEARGISFWNNALLPILFVAMSLLSGASVAVLAYGVHKDVALRVGRLEDFSMIAAAVALVIFMTYMIAAYTSTKTAKTSVEYLIAGKLAPLFWVGVLLGLIVPVGVFLPNYLDEMGRAWMAGAGASQLVGTFCMTYCVLKAGLYSPMLSH